MCLSANRKERTKDVVDHTLHDRKCRVSCYPEYRVLYGPRRDADGGVREWHRSPVARLQIADQSFLFYLQIVLAAVSIISGILLLLGVRRSNMRIIQTVSTIGATVLFVIIMIVTADSNARYA